MEGLITRILSNDYTIETKESTYICKSRGKFRFNNQTPLVGDGVIFNEKTKYVMDIKPRKNSLIRPPIANIDQAVIIASTKDPDFDSNLLDKLLVTIEFNNIKPIICFTKLDLLNSNELESMNKIMDYYKSIGYQVYRNTDLDLIEKLFKNKITVFTGQSGSGKSTLLNMLDNDLNLKTNQISYALGRGKHTTRHTELLHLKDGLVADTPGFSSITFDDMSVKDIRDNFIEFNTYKANCKYRDCMHDKEDDCFIKNNSNILKSRYDNYIKFIMEKR